ncbi:MAG TPA: MBL fold metallo-hydrolase [Clostridia bacterium]|nr:MBL fold metallo-hydrolase [Clostridia bacterium]HQM97448.1 MBL fold metallo-hydrolase [Clostridia bacterium]HQO70594.1 MBL fold metallo-hydrolase [Clostridia bacterium]
MKIKYLGTAAGEGIPALLCNCEICEKSRALGGKNLRARSQALIDDILLIDMPPETYSNFHRYNIDLLDIRYWLITHTHSDHFYKDELAYTSNGVYAHHSDDWHGIDIYGSIDLKESLDKIINTEKHKKYMRYEPKLPFIKFTCNEYDITPLKANHGTENPFIYLIEKDGKTLLYAHDTGLFLEETLNYLKTSNLKLDLVSLDCTAGSMMDYHYPLHMCLGWNIKCRDELLANNLADQSTKFVLNHFSHNGTDVVYDDFRMIADKYGFITSYDGLEIEL